MDRLTLYGSFTSSSSYKPMLYLALARLPFSFRTVNLKTGVQKKPEYLVINRWGVVPSLRHRGLTILQSNVILDYLARETGHFEARQSKSVGRRASGCRGRPTTSPTSPRYAIQCGFAPHIRRPLRSIVRGRKQRCLLSTNTVRDQPFLVGDYCTIADIGFWGRMVFMAKGGFDIDNWPHLAAWAGRLKAMPGFALPYELIPSKDREFDPT